MEYHPFASIFPLMDDERLSGLRNDIKNNGLMVPIVLYEGMVLDGRNRYLACQLENVPHRFYEFAGTEIEALNYVMSLNAERRDLSSSQRAAVAIDFETHRADVAKRMKDAAKERQREGGGDKKSREAKEKSVRQEIAEPILDPDERKYDHQLAEQFDTNRAYVHQIRRIKKASPDDFENIKKGQDTVPSVIAKLDREQRAAEGKPPRLRVVITSNRAESIKELSGKLDAALGKPDFELSLVRVRQAWRELQSVLSACLQEIE